MQDVRARGAIAAVVAFVAAALVANGALLFFGAFHLSGPGGGTLAETSSGFRPGVPAARSEPVGAGRAVPGTDGWLTYTDPSQTWQVDVPAQLQELNVGEGATNLTAIHGQVTYALEWTATGGTADLFLTAETVMDLLVADVSLGSGDEVDQRDTTIEAIPVGGLDAVRFSTDVQVGAELIRYSGVLFQLRGELVSAYVLDYGGASPLEADRFLSSVRTLS